MTELEYKKIIRMLECIKIHQGAIALNKTLHNHPKINQALLEYEISYITELESNLNSES